MGKTVGEYEREYVERLERDLAAREARVAELTAALRRAKEHADELGSYARDSWSWKYGKVWDEEDAAIAAALAQQPEQAALVALCGRVAQEAFDLGESMGRGHIVTETKQQLVDRVLQGAHPVEK